jgi:hypothetical protein
MSVVQQKPDYARARPSTIIKKNVDYEGIFTGNFPIELYHKLIVIHQSVESSLKLFDTPKLTRSQIGDIKFHVTMYVVIKLTNKQTPRLGKIAEIDLSQVTNTILNEGIQNTFIVYDTMGGNNSVAKGKEFVHEVLELLNGK